MPHPALSSQSQDGGVVYASSSGAVSIINSTVTGCSAGSRYGGVVHAEHSGAVAIIGSTVTGCSAGKVRRVELAASGSDARQRGDIGQRGHGCLTPLSPRTCSSAAPSTRVAAVRSR